MNAKLFFLFAAWAILLLLLIFPAWLTPRLALVSFGDLYAYHYPLRHLAAGSLQAGHLPFWNAYIFCGLPLAANSQAVLFYPVSLLGDLFPLSLALTWDYAFHWLWAGLGMVLLARRNGLDKLSSIGLATLFCLSPFLTYRVTEGIPTLLASLSWSPWCWLALQSGRPGFLAAVWALQFLSGHPQFMVINALGMAVWIVCERRRGKLLGRFILEGLGALSLACLQWAPTLEFLTHSVRRDWLPTYRTAYALTLSSLRTWINPNALGNPLSNSYADYPSVFFETCAVFVGVTGILIAAAGIRRGAWKAGVLIALGLFLGIKGGDVVEFMRTPARYAFLSLWGLILAAGFFAQNVKSLPAWARGLAVIAAFMELAFWNGPFLRSEEASRYLIFNKEVAQKAGGKALRVMTDPDLASPNKAMLYRAMNANGYEAFYLRGYPAYVARSEGQPAADASRTYMRRYDSPGMSRAGVSFYLAGNGELGFNKGAWPLAYFPQTPPPRDQTLDISIERPESWTVRGQAPRSPGLTKLVLAQPFYPGWRAWLNGRLAAIEKWDGFFQAVEVPASGGRDFQLRLKFQPTGWPLLMTLSLAAWLIWFCLWRRGLLWA